jgi:hypothetical protein
MSTGSTPRAWGALATAAALALALSLPATPAAQPAGPRDERALPPAMPSSPPGFKPATPATPTAPGRTGSGAGARPAPAVPVEAEQVYRWTDAEGRVNLTQGLANVPEAYRARAVPLGSVSGRAGAPPPPAPDPVARQALDTAGREARSVFEHLIVARRYHRRGMDAEARAAADRAAQVASESGEWSAVAAIYDSLGMGRAADEARRRAGIAPRRTSE